MFQFAVLRTTPCRTNTATANWCRQKSNSGHSIAKLTIQKHKQKKLILVITVFDIPADWHRYIKVYIHIYKFVDNYTMLSIITSTIYNLYINEANRFGVLGYEEESSDMCCWRRILAAQDIELLTLWLLLFFSPESWVCHFFFHSLFSSSTSCLHKQSPKTQTNSGFITNGLVRFGILETWL